MAILNDPDNTRKVKEVQTPYRLSLKEEELFQFGKVNLNLLKQFFCREGQLSDTIVRQILSEVKIILDYQPNLLTLSDPISIIGDIHGQYYDLVKMVNTNILPPLSETKYLFLGDYVDRGLFSIEVVLFVISMKINHPDQVFMLRGNHQCRHMTGHFNFRDQCLQKYSQEIYDEFMEVFDALPLAALLNGNFLCLHGGISEPIIKLKNIQEIDRMKEIPKNGTFCDIVWCDPTDKPEGKLKKLSQFNESRGCAYYFGSELSKTFLSSNKLSCIIRAHEAKQEGYELHKWFGETELPPVITIFSAPNYCDFYNNKGAVMILKQKKMEIRQVEGSDHPFYLPNNINLFEWSIPYVIARLTEIFQYLLKGRELDKKTVQVQLVDRRKVIKMLRELQIDEAEQEIETMTLHGKCLARQLRNNQLAMQYMMSGREKSFIIEKQIDKNNQKRPDIDGDLQ